MCAVRVHPLMLATMTHLFILGRYTSCWNPCWRHYWSNTTMMWFTQRVVNLILIQCHALQACWHDLSPNQRQQQQQQQGDQCATISLHHNLHKAWPCQRRTPKLTPTATTAVVIRREDNDNEVHLFWDVRSFHALTITHVTATVLVFSPFWVHQTTKRQSIINNHHPLSK